jgi:hypothetical protein
MPPISDWVLERYLLRELPPEQLAELDERRKYDVDLNARLLALEESNAAILAAHPPKEVAEAIARKAHVAAVRERERARSGGWKLMFSLAPALAVLVLAVMVFLPNYGPFFGPEGETTRFKGLDPRILLFRQESAGPEALPANERVRAGDVLQVAYVAAGRTYGVVVSIDGNGVVTLHLPESEGGVSSKLQPNGEVPLSHAYELDDAPGFERFFLVTAGEPFATGQVLDAARSLAGDLSKAQVAPLALGNALEQTSVLLRKE